MKLITLLVLVTTCWATELSLPQLNRPQYSFPLQFQTPQGGAFVTESNVYFPPDTHTSIPYFTQKNSNDLQYQYLPPPGAKVLNKYPQPFPTFSSTSRPSREEDDEDEEEEDAREVFFSSTFSPANRKVNQSQNSPGPQIEIPNRPIPKALTYFNPIERIDTKYPALVSSTSSPFYHSPPMNRRMVQPPAGFMASQNQNDQIVADQMKTASFPGHQYLPPPHGYVGPTPDPVPILRLSNEMDLDGSYSYEALSADQTHVMQHGHVENVGTDHAENVVEGSYSYVGDNGQTYTVHYIADGNGFRASGDHLPVPPPVPEIIQRSIEYNMAEESSKPVHLRDGNYHEEIKSNIQMRPFPHHYQPSVLPSVPRNLFTAKQPEAFSSNHNGATSTQSNNLHSAASTQTPVVHYEAPKEQPSRVINNAPISPQITFLASQGAHDPSQSISRMFTPPTEGPIFRFGNLKNKFEQSKPEINSWPYNNPLPQDSVTKIPPPPVKNFISRSSIDSDDDDIMINFSDMTPDQYSHMYHSQVHNKDELYDEYEAKQFEHSNIKSNKLLANTRGQYEEGAKLSRESPVHLYGNQVIPNVYKNHNTQPVQFPFPQDWYNNLNPHQGYNPTFQSRPVDSHSKDQGSSVINKDGLYALQSQTYNPIIQSGMNNYNIQNSSSINKEGVNVDNRAYNSVFQKRAIDSQRSTLITKDTFIPPSQTVTSSYDYQSDVHEARQIQVNENKTTVPQYEYKTAARKNYDDDLNDQHNLTYYEIFKSNPPQPVQTITPGPIFNKNQGYASVSPITTQYNEEALSSDYAEDASKTYNVHKTQEKIEEDNLSTALQSSENIINENSTTTEENIKEYLKSNIFLKTVLKKNNETSEDLTHKIDNWKPSMQFIKKLDEKKEKKEVKMFHPKIKTINDYGDSHRKPIDISQIANLVTLKNYFESNKLKPKQKHDSDFGNVRHTHVHKISNEDNISMNLNENKKNTNSKESKLIPKFEKEHFKSGDLNGNTISVKKSVDMDRIIGVAKIYKTLQRNSRLEGYGPPQLRTELMPPLQDYKNYPHGAVQGGLPPLGRAGPSMKSYLPPVFS